MLEKYYKYKMNYKKYIIFIRIGVFYECIDKDALIINQLFNYKIKRISNTFKVGFPIKNIDDITNKLKDENINYIIVDNDKLVDKSDSSINKYNKFNLDRENILYNFLRIEKIVNYIENNIMNNDISDKLDRIEMVIE